ncbi:hypothetical protein WN943_021193 [Citrus x changshan-huyou]
MSKRLIVSSHNHHQGGQDRASPSASAVLSASLHRKFDCRQMSQLAPCNKNRLFLVDTLALVRKLEAEGVPSKQAESELLCLFLPWL